MNLFKIVAQLILLYILFRIIVNFVIPAYRSITRFRKQFQQMQQQFDQQQGAQNNSGQTYQQNIKPRETGKNAAVDKGEYIEFEEVKP